MKAKTFTVKHDPLEGGYYYLQGADSVKYIPTNLPLDLQQEGLTIRCQLSILPDAVSVFMTGTIVKLSNCVLVSRV